MVIARQVRTLLDPARTRPLRAALWLAGGTGVLTTVGLWVRSPWGQVVVGVAVSVGIAGVLLHVERSKESLLHEARSLWGLSGVIGGGRAWPAPGGWALGADALLWVLSRLDGRAGLTVVELGPGTSSVVLGRGLRHASLWGLEHDPTFFDVVTRLLSAHEVENYTLLHAPLSSHDDGPAWYADTALQSLPSAIDLLIVDGPPNLAGAGARAHALPRLRDRLAPGALILVDDTHRADERQMAAAWVAADPALSVDHDGGSFMALRVADGPAPLPDREG